MEIIEASMAAFNRGDWDAALSYTTPGGFKADTSRDLNETRGIYETPEEVKRSWERFYAQWDSWRVEIDEFVHVGENVVVTRQTGYLRGRDGIEVTARTSAVWRFQEGAVTEFIHYSEVEDALEAAGLSE